MAREAFCTCNQQLKLRNKFAITIEKRAFLMGKIKQHALPPVCVTFDCCLQLTWNIAQLFQDCTCLE